MFSHPLWAGEIINKPEDLENIQEYFYEGPVTQIPSVEVVEGSMMTPVRGMPLFKKTRIKITNFLREREYNNAQKLLEKEKALQAELDKEELKHLNELNVNYVENSNETEIQTDNIELEGGVIILIIMMKQWILSLQVFQYCIFLHKKLV